MAEKQIKHSPPGKKTAIIRPGDKFMIDPRDYLWVPGVGKFWNRSNHAIIMEMTAEDIRHGE